VLCETVDQLDSLLTEIAAGLDADCLGGAQAAGLARRFAAFKSRCGAIEGRLARRVAATGQFVAEGYRSAESWLAGETGESTGAARTALLTAEACGQLTGLEAAVCSGELSGSQAAEVARGALVDPAAETELLEVARTGSLQDLRAKADLVEAAARSREDEERRYARVRANRHLRTWRDGDGSFRGKFSLTPDDGALLMASIEREANHLFDLARREGRRQSREAYLADALVAVVNGSAGAAHAGADRPPDTQESSPAGPPAAERHGPGHCRTDHAILLRIDLEALVRGSLAPGEECSLDGVGPVPISVVERYLKTAGLRLVITDGYDIHSIVKFSRVIPKALQTALQFRDRTCVVPGCSSTFHLETDHIVEVNRGGPTSLANLCRLCRYHHSLKSNRGYKIEGGPGKWRWLPPPRSGTSGGAADEDDEAAVDAPQVCQSASGTRRQ